FDSPEDQRVHAIAPLATEQPLEPVDAATAATAWFAPYNRSSRWDTERTSSREHTPRAPTEHDQHDEPRPNAASGLVLTKDSRFRRNVEPRPARRSISPSPQVPVRASELWGRLAHTGRC